MFGMCINKRVVIGAAAVALALLAIAPGLFGAIAPVLVMAVCPLSMLLMMRGMRRTSEANNDGGRPDDGERQLRELDEEVNRLKAELALRNQS